MSQIEQIKRELEKADPRFLAWQVAALVEFIEAVEGYFWTTTDQDETVKAFDRLQAARRKLRLE